MATATAGARRAIDGSGKTARPRGPGVAYAATSVILVSVVAALAVTSKQSAPPTIAEFAPRAVEQITDSSGDRTASTRGAAGAGADTEQRTDPEDAARGGMDVARVRRCVGDPPRQIEDPQSPPCVPYWSGDNGGATSHGVTRDEIRVTEPIYNGSSPAALIAFFNKRFELYGRRMRVIPRSVPLGNAEQQRASARGAYEEDQAFASTAAIVGHAYFEELARLGIVGVDYNAYFPETYLAGRRPYLWTYPMANDRIFAATGDWYCARFAGSKAVHAGDPALQMSPRKLGIILTTAGPEGTSAEPMNARLESCGARTDEVIESGMSYGTDTASVFSFMENAMLQMKTAGVTTLVCMADVSHVGSAMVAATNQAYFPEWLLNDYVANESAMWIRLLGSPEQRKNLMLLLAHPMQRHFADHPSNWAMHDVNPAGYPATTLDQWILNNHYRQLLLLVSGFQMAGPHLTPRTFERGLQAARFPNPAHPIMAGAVGFDDGDHSMTDDHAEVWWNETAPSPYGDGPGTFCYVDGGARRRIGTFSTGDPFFSGACATGA